MPQHKVRGPNGGTGISQNGASFVKGWETLVYFSESC